MRGRAHERSIKLKGSLLILMRGGDLKDLRDYYQLDADPSLKFSDLLLQAYPMKQF